MQIENHKEEVPFAHYEELFKNLDPADAVSRLCAIKWDGKEFYVNLLGREFAVSHPAYAMVVSDQAIEKCTEVMTNMTYLELSTYPGYMDSFVAACFIPHTDRNLFPNSIQEI